VHYFKAGTQYKDKKDKSEVMMIEEKTHERLLIEAFLDDDEEAVASLASLPGGGFYAASGEMTPLIACVVSGHYEYVDAILAKTDKASVDAKSAYGSTALTIAASGSAPEAARAAEALIRAGADVNAKDEMGWSVLAKVALNSPSLALLKLLLKKGARVNDASDLGVTPLMAAVKRDDGNVAFAKALLDKGADSEARTHNGEKALDLAREDGSQEIVRLLEAAAPRRVFWRFRYLPAAAVLLLSLGAAFVAGVTTGNPRILSVPSTGGVWEAEELYRGKIVETLNTELRATLEEQGAELPPDFFLGTNAGWNLLCRVLDSKRDLDWHLEEIAEASGESVGMILAFPFLDVSRLDGNSAAVYGKFLKDHRTKEIELAAPWIKLDPNFYFDLAEKLPRETWERYPADEAYLEALSLIADLPEELKAEALKLSPDEAKKVYKKQRKIVSE
jgi:hypothetical protein